MKLSSSSTKCSIRDTTAKLALNGLKKCDYRPGAPFGLETGVRDDGEGDTETLSRLHARQHGQIDKLPLENDTGHHSLFFLLSASPLSAWEVISTAVREQEDDGTGVMGEPGKPLPSLLNHVFIYYYPRGLPPAVSCYRAVPVGFSDTDVTS